MTGDENLRDTFNTSHYLVTPSQHGDPNDQLPLTKERSSPKKRKASRSKRSLSGSRSSPSNTKVEKESSALLSRRQLKKDVK